MNRSSVKPGATLARWECVNPQWAPVFNALFDIPDLTPERVVGVTFPRLDRPSRMLATLATAMPINQQTLNVFAAIPDAHFKDEKAAYAKAVQHAELFAEHGYQSVAIMLGAETWYYNPNDSEHWAIEWLVANARNMHGNGYPVKQNPRVNRLVVQDYISGPRRGREIYLSTALMCHGDAVDYGSLEAVKRYLPSSSVMLQFDPTIPAEIQDGFERGFWKVD